MMIELLCCLLVLDDDECVGVLVEVIGCMVGLSMMFMVEFVVFFVVVKEW